MRRTDCGFETNAIPMPCLAVEEVVAEHWQFAIAAVRGGSEVNYAVLGFSFAGAFSGAIAARLFAAAVGRRS
jgi:hypothetical protein